MMCSKVIYDKSHSLQVFSKNGYVETRTLNLNILDGNSHIQVKLRDESDFVFNYTLNVDPHSFEALRHDQSLDIDFGEFRSSLLELLEQVERAAMHLKCESASHDHCKLLFYEKSKIKSIIHLALDLELTNQKEIFDEMRSEIAQLHSLNKNLSQQVHHARKLLDERNAQFKHVEAQSSALKRQFLNDLSTVSAFFGDKLQECSRKLVERLVQLAAKVVKLVEDVEEVKAESLLKSASSARLVESMENLRLEAMESSAMVNELQRENCRLKSSQLDSEKVVGELRRTIERNEADLCQLQRQRDEFEADARQATMIIAQKQQANEELARDLVQANQMLVNFNHLFDRKGEEIEQLKVGAEKKEKMLQEMSQRYLQMKSEFEEYQGKFNAEHTNKLGGELLVARKRIEELEKLNRETVKLNELLTRKLAAGDFARSYN